MRCVVLGRCTQAEATSCSAHGAGTQHTLNSLSRIRYHGCVQSLKTNTTSRAYVSSEELGGHVEVVNLARLGDTCNERSTACRLRVIQTADFSEYLR